MGTLFFNIDTFRAMQGAYDNSDVDQLIWRPEAIGSVCFLISGVLGYLAVRHFRSSEPMEWRIAVINLAGCVLFGISAIAGYVVPSSGSVLDLALANWSTSLGALCFLIGSVMILPRFAGDPGASRNSRRGSPRRTPRSLSPASGSERPGPVLIGQVLLDPVDLAIPIPS